ncbi:hypothetical protein HA402_006372 [Bradysia odoriphaga]|nr:hypothetical protein HA402_006372 [Bradysia odoriphaga]
MTLTLCFRNFRKSGSASLLTYKKNFLLISIAKSMVNRYPTTISNWIARYDKTGTVCRKSTVRDRSKIDDDKREWLLNLYRKCPILYLEEAKHKFERNFGVTISASYICKILHENNFTWKTLEIRAIQIKDEEIEKFYYELNSIEWHLTSLVFLDEVSVGNHGLIRSKGYGAIGKKLVFRGEFNRKPRMSLLCFLGQQGILETYQTEGTFCRKKFFDCCKDFALGGICSVYPGKHSVWILDGAKIHCHPPIIRYFRSIGIIPIFLPPYTPFFNPIEIVFGVVKKHLKKKFAKSTKNMEFEVNAEFTKMTNFNCTSIFKACSYVASGTFDPCVAQMQNPNQFGFK